MDNSKGQARQIQVITLRQFEQPIPLEFMKPLSSYLNIVKTLEECVVYFNSDKHYSDLVSGYYKLCDIEKCIDGSRRVRLYANHYGLYSVAIENCYLTQELIHAYTHGIKIKIEGTIVEDDNLVEILRDEITQSLAINSIDL